MGKLYLFVVYNYQNRKNMNFFRSLIPCQVIWYRFQRIDDDSPKPAFSDRHYLNQAWCSEAGILYAGTGWLEQQDFQNVQISLHACNITDFEDIVKLGTDYIQHRSLSLAKSFKSVGDKDGAK